MSISSASSHIGKMKMDSRTMMGGSMNHGGVMCSSAGSFPVSAIIIVLLSNTILSNYRYFQKRKKNSELFSAVLAEFFLPNFAH